MVGFRADEKCEGEHDYVGKERLVVDESEMIECRINAKMPSRKESILINAILTLRAMSSGTIPAAAKEANARKLRMSWIVIGGSEGYSQLAVWMRFV